MITDFVLGDYERSWADAFLRRCVFHYIAFPDRERMRKIVDVHLPDLSEKLIESAFQRFYGLRRLEGIRKKPSTSELVDWLSVLARAGVAPEDITAKIPFPGILLKQEVDLELAKVKR